MSATGLEVFDKTLQTTNTWLEEIAEHRPRPAALLPRPPRRAVRFA
jgi:hypothetical protein